MSQFVRTHWGPEQGFPKGAVYAVSQTSDGYLWIGTESGLVRFDGWNFRLVQDPSGVFPITTVLGLIPGQAGRLWMLSQNQTLLGYRSGAFENPPFDGNISAISQSRNGELLLSKMEGGIFDLRDGTFRRLDPTNELPRSAVVCLAQTREGDIWLGTRDAGLFRITGGRTLSMSRDLSDLKVNALAPDRGSELWIGTDNGIVRWNGTTLTNSGVPASLVGVQALALRVDRDANLWIGTNPGGLARLNARGVSWINGQRTSAEEPVTALFEDREGNLWAGSADGLERIRDSPFVTYSLAEGMPSENNGPIFADPEGRLWFAPVQGGLWWLREDKRVRLTEAGLPDDVVYSITGGRDGLWLGRQIGGLTHLRSKQDSFIADTYTTAQGLAQNSVYSVYESRDGSVWAGTLSGGVSRLNQGRFSTYTSKDGLASNTVASIAEDSDGTMWFATPSGLSALTSGRWRTFEIRDGLPSDNINCLLEDTRGVLWIGTANGLSFRNSDGIQTVAQTAASLREQILGIAEDKNGSLWIATSTHVLRANREKLIRRTLADGDVREFTLADGLRGVQGVKRSRSVISDQSGRVWFSLNRGISVVDTTRLKGNSPPAIPQIQMLFADGRAIDLEGPIHLLGSLKRLTFEYAGLSLSVPERVRFRYMLEGFENVWSSPVTAREAVYTNLSPGSYRFRVIASNPDGFWNPQESVSAFVVDPLFWQTWWFRLAVVLACGLVVLVFYRLRLHQLTRRLNLRFEERLAERTRIAQELHDTLLQGFLSASMQVHVAADSLPEDSQVKPMLVRALQRMGQVIEEGRNALRGLRSSKSASLDLEDAFSLMRQELGPLAKEDVEFRVIQSGQQRHLHPLLRDEVYRIGREALLNAFRHSQASRIEIELKYSSTQLRMFVRDNGLGIDPSIIEAGRVGHFGLSGMRERADRIGARLHVFSQRSGGTEIELAVPGHLAFQRPARQAGRKTRIEG